MAYNAVAFKKSMLAWDATAKKALADIDQEAKHIGAEDPKVKKIVDSWKTRLATLNKALRDDLDHVINAHDEHTRADLEKKALGNVKQYESFVTSIHLPAAVQTNLKNGLAGLGKALA